RTGHIVCQRQASRQTRRSSPVCASLILATRTALLDAHTPMLQLSAAPLGATSELQGPHRYFRRIAGANEAGGRLLGSGRKLAPAWSAGFRALTERESLNGAAGSRDAASARSPAIAPRAAQAGLHEFALNLRRRTLREACRVAPLSDTTRVFRQRPGRR